MKCGLSVWLACTRRSGSEKINVESAEKLIKELSVEEREKKKYPDQIGMNDKRVHGGEETPFTKDRVESPKGTKTQSSDDTESISIS